jgi:hypothetical protein
MEQDKTKLSKIFQNMLSSLSGVGRAWLEIGLALLLVLIVWIAVQPGSSMSAPLSTGNIAVFPLPTSKLHSDLTGIQNGSSIIILLVENKQIYRYQNAILVDQRGDMVYISLKRDNNDTIVTDFADRLTDTTAIYILPSLRE